MSSLDVQAEYLRFEAKHRGLFRDAGERYLVPGRLGEDDIEQIGRIAVFKELRRLSKKNRKWKVRDLEILCTQAMWHGVLDSVRVECRQCRDYRRDISLQEICESASPSDNYTTDDSAIHTITKRLFRKEGVLEELYFKEIVAEAFCRLREVLDRQIFVLMTSPPKHFPQFQEEIARRERGWRRRSLVSLSGYLGQTIKSIRESLCRVEEVVENLVQEGKKSLQQEELPQTSLVHA